MTANRAIVEIRKKIWSNSEKIKKKSSFLQQKYSPKSCPLDK